MSRKDRRFRRFSKKKSFKENIVKEEIPIKNVRKTDRNFFVRIYEEEYKKLFFIPIILLLLSFLVIGVNIAKTGEFMNKGVSLKGGITLTVPSENIVLEDLEYFLKSKFSNADISVRGLTDFGVQRAVVIESSGIDEDELLLVVKEFMGALEDYSIETIGSSLGESFFKQTMIAILLAFFFMGLVVFLYFRTVVPSIAVILAAFSDMVITLAVVNLMGMKIGTAGIAAFLMLIGYSVDTDILLSTRVLKRKGGTVMKRIYEAMKTGLTMNFTTLVAVSVALIISDSEIISQIMTIIFIGLIVDLINTWIQNVSILRYYIENGKNKKNIY